MTPKEEAANIEAIKSERRAITFGDIVATQTIAMQAAVIEFYVGEGSVPAIQWIANTITGPGHFPDLEEAQALGGAQAWFDKKMAEHEEFRAAHPMPERPVATLEAEPAAPVEPAERFFPFEFEVWQDDMPVASASGTRDSAMREAMHYAAQYAQDGPVRVFEVTRTLLKAEGAAPLVDPAERTTKFPDAASNGQIS